MTDTHAGKPSQHDGDSSWPAGATLVQREVHPGDAPSDSFADLLAAVSSLWRDIDRPTKIVHVRKRAVRVELHPTFGGYSVVTRRQAPVKYKLSVKGPHAKSDTTRVNLSDRITSSVGQTAITDAVERFRTSLVSARKYVLVGLDRRRSPKDSDALLTGLGDPLNVAGDSEPTLSGLTQPENWTGEVVSVTTEALWAELHNDDDGTDEQIELLPADFPEDEFASIEVGTSVGWTCRTSFDPDGTLVTRSRAQVLRLTDEPVDEIRIKEFEAMRARILDSQK